MLKAAFIKATALVIGLTTLLVSFQNCNNTKFGQTADSLSLSSLSVPETNKCTGPQVPCQTDRYTGFQTCADSATGPVYGVCVFQNCRAPFAMQNGICVSPVCSPGETSACTASGNSGARICEAGSWSACKWIKVTVNGNAAVSLTPENSYVVEVRSSEPNIVVNSSNFTKISGSCQGLNAAPWFLNGIQAKVGLNNFDYKSNVVTSLSGCDWRGQVISNIPGVSSSIIMTALAPQSTTNTNCVGAFSQCANGTQTFTITVPQTGTGTACNYANGATQNCGTACVGAYGPCVNGMKTYTVSTPAANGGMACPVASGTQISCSSTTPVNCAGSFGSCVNGIHTYTITTPSANGGTACPFTNGAVQTCGTNCVGAYSTCVNGSQTYQITTPAANGGMTCPVAAGSAQACGTACVGAYSTCVNGSQTYQITTPAANGGMTCPVVAGSAQACGTACVGAYGACVNGTKTYTVTTPAANGGATCPVANGSQISCTSTTPVNCVGSFGTCANGTHTYTITTPAANGGTDCPYTTGTSQSCGTNCVGAFSNCANGSQTYTITTPAANGGMSCPVANGATQTCGTNCVGAYNSCANGSQTFVISTPASNGGVACSVAAGTIRTCGTSCVGDWSACSNGSQVFQISTQASGGGLACAYSDGQTRSCGNSCVGAWSTCSNGLQSYSISSAASGGGASCPVANGATQTCGVACQGSYGACSQTCGGGVKYFNVTLAPSGGGASCPAATASCNSQACVCANGAAGSSYPSCTDCASAHPGTIYLNGQCVTPCTNGAIDPPPFGSCTTCSSSNQNYNPLTNSCQVQCHPMGAPNASLCGVQEKCADGRVVNANAGPYYPRTDVNITAWVGGTVPVPQSVISMQLASNEVLTTWNLPGSELEMRCRTDGGWEVSHNGYCMVTRTVACAAPVIEPTNFYCGAWDGKNVSATRLYVDSGRYRTYIGTSGPAADTMSCLGVWDTQNGIWVRSRLCKYANKRECQHGLLSNVQAYDEYPACPDGWLDGGDGCYLP